MINNKIIREKRYEINVQGFGEYYSDCGDDVGVRIGRGATDVRARGPVWNANNATNAKANAEIGSNTGYNLWICRDWNKYATNAKSYRYTNCVSRPG